MLDIGNSTISGAASTHVNIGKADRVNISSSTIVSDYASRATTLNNAALAKDTVHITNSIVRGMLVLTVDGIARLQPGARNLVRVRRRGRYAGG